MTRMSDNDNGAGVSVAVHVCCIRPAFQPDRFSIGIQPAAKSESRRRYPKLAQNWSKSIIDNYEIKPL